jgi:bacterial/archaeal transporter family-2 protein
MERNQALLLAIVAGGVIGCQAPINRALGSHVGNMQAALVNFLVGGTVVLVIVMFNGGLSGIASDPVRWHYLGGLAGALFVITAIVTLVPLGVTLQTLTVITAQLTIAVVIDQFGLFGVDKRPLTLEHLAGICLALAGVFVFARA